MPRIAEFAKLPDGRLAVVLDIDLTADGGEVTLWTAAERDEAIARAVRDERATCQEIAISYGGLDAEEIAELIGSRNFAK